MTAFVLDNSVTMRWCFDSGTHAYADAVAQHLESDDGEAFVPILWSYEVSAVLARARELGLPDDDMPLTPTWVNWYRRKVLSHQLSF